MATPQLLLPALARAFSLSETREPEDPEYVDALQEVREVQKGAGWVVIQVRSHGFSLGEHLVWDLPGDLARFRQVLEEAGIRELRFQEVLAPEVLADFFSRLQRDGEAPAGLPSTRFRGLEDHIGLSFRRADVPLPGMAGGIQGLFSAEPSPVPRFAAIHRVHAGGSSGAGGPSTGQAPEPPPPESEPSPEVGPLPVELVEEVETYFGSYDVLKRESENRIRTGAARLREARNLAALAALVDRLVQPLQPAPSDDDAVALAREIATPPVTSYMVARLGTSRDDGERARFTRVIARLGGEAVSALADALGEARDRSQRRAFLDAMVRLGPLGLDLARTMVRDPRWYVIRNGVTVLGEVRGENTVQDLTGPLTAEDSRVRVATVLALAKVRGEEVEPLVLGRLEDPAPEVRAAACRGLAVLGSDRAVPVLEKLLEDPDADVQIECLRALGHIGDPRPVALIQKRALGRPFGKPPRDIRITAFRALAAIGTPAALKTVEKGARDRDKEVRKVAEMLLSER